MATNRLLFKEKSTEDKFALYYIKRAYNRQDRLG